MDINPPISIFPSHIINKLKAIPILISYHKDRIICKLKLHGKFSTKVVTWEVMTKPILIQKRLFFKNNIWKFNLILNIQIFLWKQILQTLITRYKIRKLVSMLMVVVLYVIMKKKLLIIYLKTGIDWAEHIWIKYLVYQDIHSPWENYQYCLDKVES